MLVQVEGDSANLSADELREHMQASRSPHSSLLHWAQVFVLQACPATLADAKEHSNFGTKIHPPRYKDCLVAQLRLTVATCMANGRLVLRSRKLVPHLSPIPALLSGS